MTGVISVKSSFRIKIFFAVLIEYNFHLFFFSRHHKRQINDTQFNWNRLQSHFPTPHMNTRINYRKGIDLTGN